MREAPDAREARAARSRLVLLVLLVLLVQPLVLLNCASPAIPPGGPPDIAAPHLLHVLPDSGQVNSKAHEVVFQFNEIVSETPRGAQDLRGLVLISPSDGQPVVEWHRDRISARPRRGWRPNTTYVVTLLPGIADLANNARDSADVVVFSTGASIPQTRLDGVIFDWTRGLPAVGAYIEARPVTDTTLVFATQSDSIGLFSFPFLSPDRYSIRAILDGNHNRKLDLRESFDSTLIAFRDTARIEFYAFVHDSGGPSLSQSTATTDSVTLHVVFDRPLTPTPAYLPTIEVTTIDSVPVRIAQVSPWSTIAELRARAARAKQDSIADADTSSVRREARDRARRDSINRAAVIADSVSRDTTKRVEKPVLKRPVLTNEVGVIFAAPLAPGTKYRVTAKAIGVIGTERASVRTFETPKSSPVKPPERPPPPS